MRRLAAGPGKVWATGLDHFKAYGFQEGRRHSILYVESIYLQKNADVVAGVGRVNADALRCVCAG